MVPRSLLEGWGVQVGTKTLKVGGLGGHFGCKLGVLGMLTRTWRGLGTYCLQVGECGGHLGCKMVDLRAILAPSWRVLVPSWLQVGPSWLQVGGSWDHFCSNLGGLGSKLGHLGSKLWVQLALQWHFAKLAKNIEKSMIFIVFSMFFARLGSPSWQQNPQSWKS